MPRKKKDSSEVGVAVATSKSNINKVKPKAKPKVKGIAGASIAHSYNEDETARTVVVLDAKNAKALKLYMEAVESTSPVSPRSAGARLAKYITLNLEAY